MKWHLSTGFTPPENTVPLRNFKEEYRSLVLSNFSHAKRADSFDVFGRSDEKLRMSLLRRATSRLLGGCASRIVGGQPKVVPRASKSAEVDL